METEFHSGPNGEAGETDGKLTEVLEKRTGFCKHAYLFCEGIQTCGYPSQYVYVFDEKHVEFAVISLLSHEKSPKIPEISQFFGSTFPVRRLASLERMVYLESCGLTEGWFPVGKAMGFTRFTLGNQQEQVVEIIG